MKKKLINLAFLIAVGAVAASGVSAQITFSIPGLKKIIKKPAMTNVETTTQVNDDPATRTNPTTVHGNAMGSTSWWVDYQIEAITKYEQQVDQWDRESQVFPKPTSSDDYIGLAFSKKERASWLRDKKVGADARLEAALDELKASLTHRMPEYTMNPKSFTHRNAAEENLMLAQMSDVPGMKVFKIGFNQPTWLIDRNEWGIPKARYKHGMIYGRSPASEDRFCRVWYINVVQQYNGAGTYGPTEARYIEREFIACPEEQ